MKTAFSITKATDAMRRALGSLGDMDDGEIDRIVFHMTDWDRDLAEYVDFLRSPGSRTDDEIVDLLIRFLIHVPDHVRLAAASVLDARPQKKRRPPARARVRPSR